MENNHNTIRILTLTVILLAAFLAILYVYPFKPAVINAQQNVTNGIKLQDFLSSYNINLSRFSDSDLYYFYGGLQNNSIVFGCSYELEPAFPAIPLNSSVAQNEYNSVVRDMTLLSMCSVENKTNCSAAEKQLYSFINGSINATRVQQLFNFTYSEMTGYYRAIVNSGYGNYSITNPLKYDIGLFNSSTNKEEEINAILEMKQIPVNIVFGNDGKLLDYANETGIYSPFQFSVYRLLNASACSYSNIFNVVVDPSYFSSPAYSYIYKNLGNITNICIKSGTNSCSPGEMKNLNMSFYAN
jgi:hypothetical protein